MDSGLSTPLESKPPDDAPTIPTDGSHEKESESVSQDKVLPPELFLPHGPFPLNGPPLPYGPPSLNDPPPLYGPPPPNVHSFVPFNRERGKRRTAFLACVRCRQIKAKCDGEKPCSRCVDSMAECIVNPPLPKLDREIADISTKIDGLQEYLKRLAQHLPVFDPTRGREPALTSLEKHLGSQEPIPISPAQLEILRDLETAFSRLREFDNWDALGPRLAWYCSSLCKGNNFAPRQEPVDEDDRDITMKGQSAVKWGSQSRAASRERQSVAESELSPAGLKRKRSSSLHGEPDKPFFCFHQSCGRMYGSGKTLENHLRNHHNGRWPNLPGTCDHEASIKRFSNWEECLEHFIFHQKTGMDRKEYDRALESAEYLISHSNQQVDAKKNISSPAASLIGGSPLSLGYGTQQSDPRALTASNNFVWPSNSFELDFEL